LEGAESYLRVERRGTKLVASISDDGSRWIELVPVELAMPQQVRIGVFAVSTTTKPFAPTFDQLQLKTGSGPRRRVAWPSNLPTQREPVVIRTTPNPTPAPPPRKRGRTRNRLAAPDANAQANARKQIQVMYRDDYKDRSKRSLAAQLRKESDRQGNLTLRYTMLSEACELAARAGDYAEALHAAARLGEQFADDPLEWKCRAVEQALPAIVTKTDYRGLCQRVLLLVDRARFEEQYDLADRFLKVARAAAEKADMSAILKKAAEQAGKQVTEWQKEYEAIRPAVDKLDNNPQDEEACLRVGKFRCFTREDWDGGLPLLERGRDTGLRDLAQKELAVRAAAADQAELGDRWAAQADKMSDKEDKSACRRRAYSWYQQSLVPPDPKEQGRSPLDAKERRRVEAQLAKLLRNTPELSSAFHSLDMGSLTPRRKLLHLPPQHMVATRQLYRGPIDIRVTAGIKGRLRITFLNGGALALEPDGKNVKVQVYSPFGNDPDEPGGRASSGFGKVVAGPVQQIRMHMTKDGWKAEMNGQMTGSQGGTNMGGGEYGPAPVRIWSEEGEVDLLTVEVRRVR
jgi:hypothetical protein